ncbi:MAG: hypothetical protein LC803_09470 [Acidobacteria bacterium]|nr:hypothetical protein [Acidobacteriota bacterium]
MKQIALTKGYGKWMKGKTLSSNARKNMSIAMTGMNTTHGMSKTPTYRIWASMVQRCSYRKHRYYRDYGGRGITVCERWLRFENFYRDMGKRPEGLTLDRIDNNDSYSPTNCQWASRQQQANNRRSNKTFTINGITRNLKQWADAYGVSYKVLHQRIHRDGMTIAQALLIEQEA